MTLNEVTSKLDSYWSNKSHTKLNWLDFEQFLADILSGDFDNDTKVRLSCEALDAFTRRGHFVPENYFRLDR